MEPRRTGAAVPQSSCFTSPGTRLIPEGWKLPAPGTHLNPRLTPGLILAVLHRLGLHLLSHGSASLRNISLTLLIQTITQIQLVESSRIPCATPSLCSLLLCTLYSMNRMVGKCFSGEFWPISTALIFTCSLQLVTWKQDVLFLFDL